MGSMNSFYGGPAGKSFTVKKIFTSKNGLTDSLAQDLALGWFSMIGVGDYVVVSYGLPSDENYDIFKKIDLDADQVSYNSTLWVKAYDEDHDEANNGLSYKLIASLTGNTPKFKIDPVEVLNANEKPRVVIDNTDVDLPVITFSLPQSQILSMKEPVNILDADKEPQVVYDDKEDINKPTVEFSLPRSQVIKEATVEETLVVGSTPSVRLDLETEGGVNNPVLKFKLPASQKISPENVNTHEIDADQTPRVEFKIADPNNPTLDFYLPQSQILAEPITQVIGPDGQPHVTLDSEHINSPQYTFQLPRAVKFYYGDRLGQKDGGPFTDEYEGYATYGVGDYYINVPSGYIYLVTGVEGNRVTFAYQACLQAPKPEIGETVALSPYTDQQQTEPKVDMSVDEAQHSWSLTFSLPKMPKFSVNKDFVAAPADAGSIDATIVDNDTVELSFKVPRGSRLFNGDGEPEGIDEAKSGDYYLDMATGKIYQYAGTEWQVQQGSLQGPVGNALNIVASYRLEETEDYKDTLENGSTYIEANYTEVPITNEDIFAITWVSQDKSSEISYWQYKLPDGTWSRAQLTGGIASILVREYSDDANKAYNTGYVNSLINSDELQKDRTAYSKTQLEKLLSWGTFDELKEG